jgi:hypothetical protein
LVDLGKDREERSNKESYPEKSWRNTVRKEVKGKATQVKAGKTQSKRNASKTADYKCCRCDPWLATPCLVTVQILLRNLLIDTFSRFEPRTRCLLCTRTRTTPALTSGQLTCRLQLTPHACTLQLRSDCPMTCWQQCC